MIRRIVEWCHRHYYLSTGILMFFSFPSYDVWFLKGFPLFAWFALVPLLMHVRTGDFRRVYADSFLAGMLGIFLTYHWIGDFGNKIPGGDIVILCVVIPVLAVVFATKILVAEYLSRRFERLRLLIYPSVWIVVDGIQSIGFLAFPWTYWGYSQYTFSSFVQVSSLVGIFGVTFIMILASAAVADFARAAFGRPFSFRWMVSIPAFRRLAMVAVLVAMSVLYGAIRMAVSSGGGDSGRLRLAMIQSCIDPWEAWDSNKFMYLGELGRLTDAAMRESPDFIIWSESATLELISYNFRTGSMNPFTGEVLEIARSHKRPLLTGEIGILEEHYGGRIYPQNNAVLISKEGVPVQTYPKINLVPFGEWFPYEKWFPFIKRITESFGASSFVPGSSPSLFEVEGRRFGALICYEGIFQRLCREYRVMGADYFINITNLGWTQTYKGHMQGFANATFRAVENGIWFVSAGNTGYTALVDPLGRVTTSIPILKKGYLVGEIDFSMNRRTFYSMAGDLVLYASILLLAGLGAMTITSRVRGRCKEAAR
ncbi:MAG TPA: apolipoprotein N-acyltransferase [Spirochaetota bacterium]|nr:apolipoprotein N-acyltransferase [Spirochaetota bacterium]